MPARRQVAVQREVQLVNKPVLYESRRSTNALNADAVGCGSKGRTLIGVKAETAIKKPYDDLTMTLRSDRKVKGQVGYGLSFLTLRSPYDRDEVGFRPHKNLTTTYIYIGRRKVFLQSNLDRGAVSFTINTL